MAGVINAGDEQDLGAHGEGGQVHQGLRQDRRGRLSYGHAAQRGFGRGRAAGGGFEEPELADGGVRSGATLAGHAHLALGAERRINGQLAQGRALLAAGVGRQFRARQDFDSFRRRAAGELDRLGAAIVVEVPPTEPQRVTLLRIKAGDLELHFAPIVGHSAEGRRGGLVRAGEQPRGPGELADGHA